MVRVGIGCYGLAPADELEGRRRAAPGDVGEGARLAREVGSRAAPGCRTGCVTRPTRATRIATVPIGYADGVPRELPHHGGAAIVRGRRCPMAGTVTMDQLMLDVGDLPVEVGDEVVLIGRQGDEEITAASWARAMGTIAYTIVCGIGPRVPAGVPPVSRRRGVAQVAGVALGAAGAVGRRGLRRASACSRGGCSAGPTATRHARSTRPMYVDRRLDSFDGGSIYVVESGEGPPIVLSHGVTNSIREWFHQLESLPRAGFRTIAFDHRGHGQSMVGTAGHSLENLAQRRAHRRGGSRPARRGAGRPLDGWRRGAGVRDAVSRRSRPSASPASCCSRRSPRRRSAPTRREPRSASSRSPNHAPDMSWVWASPNLGLAPRPARVRAGPASEPRRARAPDAARLPARDAPRSRRGR